MLEDYDEWAAQGCDGWSGEETLPYFNKLEDDLDFGDAPYHGRGGPIPIYRAPLETWGPVDQALREAALALGYGWNDDHNAPFGSGVSPYAINSRDFQRVSTNDAYLEPARDRPNLTILGDALVERVLFDGTRATGVRARVGGEWTTFAAREVILSAGSVYTPPILLRSGVGPAEELRELGVDGAARPAGRAQIWSITPIVGLGLELRPERALHVAQRAPHQLHRALRLRAGRRGRERHGLPGAQHEHRRSRRVWRIGYIGVSAFQTFSRGQLRIVSADPDCRAGHRDPHALRRARPCAHARRRAAAVRDRRHPAVPARATASRWRGGLRADQPGSPDTIDDIADDAALDAWLFATVADTQHPVGTCRMGAPDDPRSRRRSRLPRARRRGLRVIDASIMPDVPRANTHLTCVMIGERMAAQLRRG